MEIATKRTGNALLLTIEMEDFQKLEKNRRFLRSKEELPIVAGFIRAGTGTQLRAIQGDL